MSRMNYDRIKEELCNGGAKVLEYSSNGVSINDITDSVIGVSYTKGVGVDSNCVKLLIKRDGRLEKMMANAVFTSHGMRIFIEDILGSIELDGFTII